MVQKTVLLVLAWVVGLLALGACGERGGPASTKLSVVATTGMIADAARRVAGDRAEVVGLMGEGVDPHLYKVTPGDVRLLERADLVLYNGLHLEGRMVDALERLDAGAKSGKRSVAVTDSLPKDRLRHGDAAGKEHDPHVWFDVSLWTECVERIRDALVATDPNNAEVYRRNAAVYVSELADLHAWTKDEMARIPAESRVLVTAHDAFGYFGKAYGVEVLAIQGISTDSEAGLKDVNALIDTLVKRKVRAVFVESSVPEKAVRALVDGAKSKGHELVVGGQLYSDALGKDGTPDGTYAGMVRHNVRTIVAALAPGARAIEGGAKP